MLTSRPGNAALFFLVAGPSPPVLTVIAYVFGGLRSRERPEDVGPWARKRGWVVTSDHFCAGSYGGWSCGDDERSRGAS